MLTISVEQLNQLHACQQGIDTFRRYFGEAYTWNMWGVTEQAALLGNPECCIFWSWLVAQGVIPSWSMCYWILSGANLSGANLSGANLYGANLYGANLSGANLTRATGYQENSNE